MTLSLFQAFTVPLVKSPGKLFKNALLFSCHVQIQGDILHGCWRNAFKVSLYKSPSMSRVRMDGWMCGWTVGGWMVGQRRVDQWWQHLSTLRLHHFMRFQCMPAFQVVSHQIMGLNRMTQCREHLQQKGHKFIESLLPRSVSHHEKKKRLERHILCVFVF